VAWQIAAEVIVPLNQAGGHGTGFRADRVALTTLDAIAQ
jgi:hypothetical protein